MAEVINNKEKNRYELKLDGHTAIAEYILNKQGVLFFTHTEVPKDLEGEGVASKLMESAFDDAEERGLKIAPICPFVKSYIQRHPEWKRLLAEEHRF
ncbi:GNAT family N-acetyltransferase [Rhodohalobacter barkolensis]|uniref:N-acetyltransferase n=1 Tax=Rhodohalobacter barkolensis TaxID=2053187 RepID=A0A2N0VEA7_9BACT|nr:GNAT family N-acetyltransferase [Rhodohalobacter barkolensis]PKD42522.1 N-acetyltransferase [Rhodohalobacter barkolensis]